MLSTRHYFYVRELSDIVVKSPRYHLEVMQKVECGCTVICYLEGALETTVHTAKC